MVLTGGGALLRDLDRLLMEETGLPVIVADDPLTCVVRGSGKALEKMEQLRHHLHQRLIGAAGSGAQPPAVLQARPGAARPAVLLRLALARAAGARRALPLRRGPAQRRSRSSSIRCSASPTAPVDLAQRVGELLRHPGAAAARRTRELRAKVLDATRRTRSATRRSQAENDAAAPADRRRASGSTVQLDAAEILYAGRDPFTRKVIIDRGAQTACARAAGGRRDRRGRPGDARASAALRGDADHRQGPGGAGAGGAQRPARRRLRRRRRRHARAALHAGQRRDPERRPARHLRHRRHLSAGPAGGDRGAHRARRRPTRSRASSASRRPASTAAATCWCCRDERTRAAAARGGAAGQGRAPARHARQRAEGRPMAARRSSPAHPAPGAREHHRRARSRVALLLNFLPWQRPARWCPTSSRWCSSSGACTSRAWSASASPGCSAC